MTDLWTWHEVVLTTPGTAGSNKLTATDVTGFDVEATDGDIGKVDEATYDVGGSYLVVDTGFWIFGKKRMIPASVVERIDQQERKVFLSMSKDEVKNAPDFDADRVFKDQRRTQDDYYTSYGTTAARRK